MASSLHRSRATAHLLFQNLKTLKPSTPHLHSKSLHSNPKIPLHLFSPKTPKIQNPNFLQSHSISTSKITSQSLAPPNPGLKHQEITGPTVEPDTSPLANETREVLQSLRRSVHDLSSALALLGVAHLGLGAWMVHGLQPPNEVLIQGLAAFAFPFSTAFLLRRAVKPMAFYLKMEQQRRLQVLTLALQVSKNLRVLFVRMRVVCFCSVVGVFAGSVGSMWMR